VLQISRREEKSLQKQCCQNVVYPEKVAFLRHRTTGNLLAFNKTVLINKLAINIIESLTGGDRMGIEVNLRRGYGGIDWINLVSCIIL
jgi:hypothetical protein